MEPASNTSVYGRNDEYGLKNCNYDFTGFSVRLLDRLRSGRQVFRVAVVHPNSVRKQCREYEVERYWERLVDYDSPSIIAGDWNAGWRCLLFTKSCTDKSDQIQFPPTRSSPHLRWRSIYSNGLYWEDLAYRFPHDPTAAGFGTMRMWLDHAFSNFGEPCVDCGHFYGTHDLEWGVAIGGSDGMERADGGSGCDHRQILWDMWM